MTTLYGHLPPIMVKTTSSPFGGQGRTRVLLALSLLGESYPRELARLLEMPLSGVQGALRGLELDGLVVGRSLGRTRVFQLNPRYFAAAALGEVLRRPGAPAGPGGPPSAAGRAGPASPCEDHRTVGPGRGGGCGRGRLTATRHQGRAERWRVREPVHPGCLPVGRHGFHPDRPREAVATGRRDGDARVHPERGSVRASPDAVLRGVPSWASRDRQ